MIGDRFEGEGMAQSFAKQMVAALQVALSSNVGVTQVTADGQTIVFQSRADMESSYDYWTRRAAQEGGKRTFRSIDVGSAF